MSKSNVISKLGCVAAVVVAALTITSQARAVIVNNGSFDLNPQADATLRTFNSGGFNDLWTPVGANVYLYDVDIGRIPDQGNLVNNMAYVPSGSAVQQTLGITLANKTRYTLTLQVGRSINYIFPTVGNGVSTGDLFARLKANGGASAMPGFVAGASNVTTPWPNTNPPNPSGLVPWTLVWETGANEPLAGLGLVMDLSVGGPAGVTEAFFDSVVLTTESVPEPSTVLLLGLGGLLVWRKARRITD